MFNRRLLQATSGGDIPIPVDVPTASCGIYADIYHSRKCDAIRVILVSA